MKTPISFVQPNFQTGPKHLNAFYLPYTSGILWAYARQNKKISNNFDVEYFVYWHLKTQISEEKIYE